SRWTGCRSAAVPKPSAVTTSPPAIAHAGTRQAFSGVHSVAASMPGRATSTAQAPHSPSAHPSLAPVRPRPRSQSSRDTYGATSAREREAPLTMTVGTDVPALWGAAVCMMGDCIVLTPHSCGAPLRIRPGEPEQARASLRVRTGVRCGVRVTPVRVRTPVRDSQNNPGTRRARGIYLSYHGTSASRWGVSTQTSRLIRLVRHEMGYSVRAQDH